MWTTFAPVKISSGIFETKFVFGLDMALASPVPSCTLFAIFLHVAVRTDPADTKQMEKILSLITCEAAFCQDVCELVFGVHVFDMDTWVKIDPGKWTIELDSVVSGNMSLRRTSAFSDHLNYGFVVIELVKCGMSMRRFHVCGNMIDIGQFRILLL